MRESGLGKCGVEEGFAMKWSDKNVFVTGATGLLGSWVCKKLVELGANVVALERDTIPRSSFYLFGLNKEISQVHGPLEDYLLVERTMNEYEINVCMHLGAQTIVGTANRSPLSTFEANVKGTWNVLEAARNSKTIQAVVVASSDKAYGGTKVPYVEEEGLAANHPYDVSKACADMIAQSYFHTYGLPVGVTRCGNIFGGGDLNFSRIVPGTIRSILLNESPVIRSDGKMVRDYVYVEDIASANLLLAEYLCNGKQKGEVFNFSMEQPQSVTEVVEKIGKMMGSSMPVKIGNTATNEILVQYLSSKKARGQLKWKPVWTFESGLEKTIEWYKNYIRR